MNGTSKQRRAGWAALSLAGLAYIALHGSCAPATPPAGRDGSGAGAPHAIRSDELRKAMREVNQRSKEDIAAELYTGNPPSSDLGDVARSAAAIADVAKHIPELVASTELPADDRAEVARLSAQLRDQAMEVQARASDNNVAAVREAMGRVNQTCNACHTKFRFGGL